MTEKLGRVFMLDDDLIVLNLYREMLEKIGYEVFATANAINFCFMQRTYAGSFHFGY